METVSGKLKETNLHRVQKKEKNYRIKNNKNIEQVNTKRRKQHNFSISYPQLWWRYVRLDMNILMTHIQL